MSAISPDPTLRLVLGSGSPRRLELLGQIGVVPSDVRPPDIDETPLKSEAPHLYVARMARQKAEAVQIAADEAVLCADTTVYMGRRILGKAVDRAEAEVFLRALSGRRHMVATALGVRRVGQIWTKTVRTQVKFKRLTEDELTAYLDSDDWRGKAGAYGIQGPAATLIPWIQGSYTGVVGLPLAETAALLRAAGLVFTPKG